MVTASSPRFTLNTFNSCFSQNWQLFPSPAVNDSGGASGLFLFSHQEVVIGKVQAPGVLQRPAELPALHPSRPRACYTHRGVSAAGGPAPVTGRGAGKHPREKRRSLLFFFQYTAFGTALSCCCEWHRTRDGQLRARGCSKEKLLWLLCFEPPGRGKQSREHLGACSKARGFCCIFVCLFLKVKVSKLGKKQSLLQAVRDKESTWLHSFSTGSRTRLPRQEKTHQQPACPIPPSQTQALRPWVQRSTTLL